jgi:RHS repeat-associated protein
VTTYAYDPAGQLLSVTGDAGLDGVYAYDLHGNRSTFTDYTAGVGQTKDTYVYNKADQLDKINRQNWTGSAWGGSALFEDYTNDNAGRRIAMDDSDADTTADVTYAYDERGQIATLVDGDGTWTFNHDGEGVVNEFSLGATATPLVWDRSRTGGELLVFGPSTDFVTQVDGLGRYRSTGVQPMGQDHEGSAIKSLGYETYPQSYDPFGDATSSTSIATSHIGYRDELQYADLVHLRNRDYDPSTGAFTSMDPLATGQPNSPELGTGIPFGGGTPVGPNAYHYVGNDPLNWVDPLGLCRAEDGTFTMDYEIEGENSPTCMGSTDDQCWGEGTEELYGTDDDTLVAINMAGRCSVEGWEEACEGAIFGGIEVLCDTNEPIVNFAGGALNLNPYMLAADPLADALGRPITLRDHGVDSSSNWYTAGNVTMFAVDVAAGGDWAGFGIRTFRYPNAGGGGIAFTRSGSQLLRADVHRMTIRQSFRFVPRSWVGSQRMLPHLHLAGSGRHWPYQTLRPR